MISSDWVSAHEKHRPHRDDGERARLDRVAREVELHDGVVRARGDAPAQADVDRFRALVSRPQDSAPRNASAPESAQGEQESAPARDDGGDSVRTRGESPSGDARLLRGGPQRGGAGTSQSAPADATASTDPEHETPQATSEPKQARAPERASPTRDASSPAQSESSDDSAPSEGPRNTTTRNAPNDAQASARRATQADTEGARAAVAGAHRDETSSSSGDDGGTPSVTSALAVPTQISAEAASFVQAHRSAAEAPQQAAAAQAMAPALAELVEKHVKQMMVSDLRGSRLRAREVLLRMQDDVLPGTDLWLARTATGWSLRADVRSRDAYDALIAGSGDLIRRFADGALGDLTIEPIFHDQADLPSSRVPTTAERNARRGS